MIRADCLEELQNRAFSHSPSAAAVLALTRPGIRAREPTRAAPGIRELRDDGNPATVPKWIAVFQDAGVRTNVLTDQNVASTVGMAEALRDAGALLSVEGPNEPNNFPVTYEGGTSSSTTFLPVADLQRDLYAAIKADPALSGIPVFASSESGGSEPDNVGLQFLTIPADAATTMPAGTRYADYANTHNYVCGQSPSCSHRTSCGLEVHTHGSLPRLQGGRI
jgi:hypothetical protein